MKNLCKRKKVMRGWPVHWGFCFLLLLGFTAGLAVEAGAEYTRPTTNPPTGADLLFTGGQSKTLVIQLMNLSPYTLTEDTVHITALESLDKNRSTGKHSMFAPLGWPKTIPGLQGQWSGGYWTPSDTNLTAHPYNFVVAWDDSGDYVENSSMGWSIHEVHHYDPSWGSDVKNIPLRMWFTRVDPNGTPYSEILKVVVSTLKLAFSLIGISKFDVPPVYINAFFAGQELENSLFKTWNTVQTALDPSGGTQYGSDSMYFAAYTVPSSCNTCTPSITFESSYGPTTDGVAAGWGVNTGDDYDLSLVVTTHLLRGFDGPQGGISPAYGFEDDDSHYTNSPGAPRVPIVAVTLWDAHLFMNAKGMAAARATAHPLGKRFDGVLGTGDRGRYIQFASLYTSLNPSQRRTLSEALDQWLLDQPLTKQEEMLIEKLVSAMENGQTKLPPDNRK